MRTNQTFSISFFIRKKKKQPKLALLYVRITVNGKSLELSLKRTIAVNKWNLAANKMQGSSAEAKVINNKIDQTKSLLHKAYDNLQKEDKVITAQLLKARHLGTDQQHKSLSELLTYHNIQMTDVLSKGTLKNYFTTARYLDKFLKEHHKTTDLYLKQIDYRFTLDFEGFLRKQPKLHNNGVMKHMERLKKLMRLAEDLEWIDKNPTKRFKLHFDSVDVVYLTRAELIKIQELELKKPGLRLTRDIFVFACFTGLAYADVKKLNQDHIQLGIDGKKWIYTRRKKTNTAVRIPLLQEAEFILIKYQDHPKLADSDKLLPIYSNQKTNQYLKEIAEKLKIRKKLSFHTARHTFATSVTLANGVPIETVSKLLGHHKISTTQIYARVIDTKISSDIDMLREKLNLSVHKKECH